MKNSVCSFVLMLLCIALTVVVAIYGISGIGLQSALEDDAINKGLDLVGGSSITYRAIPEEGESFEAAAVRETTEELNIAASDIEVFGAIDYVVNERVIIYCFVGKSISN